jgi:hypothetical protein
MALADAPRPEGWPSVRRKGRRAGDRLRKVGWQVRQSVAEAVKEAVEHGAAESQNAFVEEALLRRLKELRREKIYAAYEEAAQDPMFMEDMRATSEAFSMTVRDGLETGR